MPRPIRHYPSLVKVNAFKGITLSSHGVKPNSKDLFRTSRSLRLWIGRKPMSSVLQIRPGLHLDQELGQNTKIMEGALRY
jgi:hypothetical protein